MIVKLNYVKISITLVAFVAAITFAYIAGGLSKQQSLYEIVDSTGRNEDKRKSFSSGLTDSPLIISKNDTVFLFSSSIRGLIKIFSPSHSSISFYSHNNTGTVVSKLDEVSLVRQKYENPNDAFYFVPELRNILTKFNGHDYYVVYGLCLLDNKKYVVINFPASLGNGETGFSAACRLER